jgi:hypothetical protein
MMVREAKASLYSGCPTFIFVRCVYNSKGGLTQNSNNLVTKN